ncbi:MAG: exosortase N [Bacteroidia bacterium]|nr:exosortase N [Bacteroidia bacterium]
MTGWALPVLRSPWLRSYGPAAAGLALLAVSAWPALHAYIYGNLRLWLCLLILPLVWKPVPGGVRPLWPLLIGLAAWGLFLLLHMRVFFFLGACSALWLWSAHLFGRSSWLPLGWMVLLSPVPDLLIDVSTFPLRMRFSAYAGAVLRAGGLPVEVQGNTFLVDGEAFSVDLSCAGFNNVTTGLVLGLALIAMAGERRGRPYALPQAALLLSGALLCLLAANLARIVTLVLFRLPPEAPAHGAVGMLYLLMYGLGPLGALLYWSARRKAPAAPRPVAKASAGGAWLLTACCCAFGLTGAWQPPPAPQPDLRAYPAAEYRQEQLPGGIAKLSTADELVYVKAAVPPWVSDHTPMICWKSEGYELRRIQERSAGPGRPYYTAELVRDGQRLSTAWWYSNGRMQTAGNWAWRMEVLRGEAPFQLVNITTRRPEDLPQALSRWLPPVPCGVEGEEQQAEYD